MDAYRLPKFSAMFDGKLSEALEIVNNCRASKRFTLREWDGQEIFYTKCLDKFTEYRDILTEELKLNSNTKTDIINKNLDNVFEVMTIMSNNNELNYNIMLDIYEILGFYFDFIRERIPREREFGTLETITGKFLY